MHIKWDLTGCPNPVAARQLATRLRSATFRDLERMEGPLDPDTLSTLLSIFNMAIWWLQHRGCAIYHIRLLLQLRRDHLQQKKLKD